MTLIKTLTSLISRRRSAHAQAARQAQSRAPPGRLKRGAEPRRSRLTVRRSERIKRTRARWRLLRRRKRRSRAFLASVASCG